MRNSLLTQAEAGELLGPIADDLASCVDDAWKRWLRNPDIATARRSTRASCVYDYITENVQTRFADRPGISLTWHHGSLVMTVDDVALIRFKKFRGRRLRTSGIDTNTRRAFLTQTGVLNGMVVTNLVVGYLLDDLEMQPERIAVAAPMGRDNLWTLDLGGDSGTGEPPVPIAPSNPNDSGPDIRSTEVVAEEQTARESDQE